MGICACDWLARRHGDEAGVRQTQDAPLLDTFGKQVYTTRLWLRLALCSALGP